jgi:hypothetical protein
MRVKNVPFTCKFHGPFFEVSVRMPDNNLKHAPEFRLSSYSFWITGEKPFPFLEELDLCVTSPMDRDTLFVNSRNEVLEKYQVESWILWKGYTDLPITVVSGNLVLEYYPAPLLIIQAEIIQIGNKN